LFRSIIWKNFGNSTTGYVPPDPAICNTNNIIIIALPTSPKIETTVYIIVINTAPTMSPKPINANIEETSTFNINRLPNIAIIAWKKPFVKNVNNHPKYIWRGLIFGSSVISVVNNEISNKPPTQKAKTVYNGVIPVP